MHINIQNALNQHGYSFQHRVVREVLSLGAARFGSPLRLVGIEVPVAVGGQNTRIDFVVETSRDHSESRLLVAECKRVNPAYGIWCFAKAPYVTPTWAKRQVVAETIIRTDESQLISAGAGGVEADECYHISLCLKTDKSGDPQPVSHDRDAIESSCAQVLKGCNGMADLLLHHEGLEELIATHRVIQLFPVVFTTAELWVTSADLATADLSSGDVELGASDVRKVEWLYYQYLQSPLLKHGVRTGTLSSDGFEDVIGREFVRTVAVVTPPGLAEFLEKGWSKILRSAAAQDGAHAR